MKLKLTLMLLVLAISTGIAQNYQLIEKKANDIEGKVIEWRRYFHEHPELSNREFNTSKKIAEHLRSLGIEVTTGVAHTGVVGVLKGGKPGPVVGLRADMDALPVIERVDLPFASKVKSKYLNKEVGVMHACGHDTHVAMLMGAAEILAGMKEELKGTVVFLFQPAEEGAPEGEEGGAKLMVKEGVLSKNKVDVVFGMHISSLTEVGQVNYKPKGAMAASDRFVIKINGKQTHGSTPWNGVDPITITAEVIQGMNNIISRQTPLTKEAAVISFGKIEGGVRNNIIPEKVTLIGTIRTLDTDMQKDIWMRIRRTVTNIAEAWGVSADIDIQQGYPVTYNNPALTKEMLPVLQETAGEGNVNLVDAITGAEDFSYFAQEVPGLYIFVGGMKKGMNPKDAPSHHTPDFFIDESGMNLGVRLLCNFTIGYMERHGK